jgi:catechol 2,3-dioxygenase-like lactoylglutathione lyase family enzyme
MVLSVRHTGLVVQDLRRSLQFYRDLLGLQVWKTATEEGAYIDKVTGIDGVKIQWVKLKASNGAIIELIQYLSHADSVVKHYYAPSNRIGCSHIAFEVADLALLYEQLIVKGYHCNNPPSAAPDGSVQVLYCHDPDGIIVELVEEVRHE